MRYGDGGFWFTEPVGDHAQEFVPGYGAADTGDKLDAAVAFHQRVTSGGEALLTDVDLTPRFQLDYSRGGGGGGGSKDESSSSKNDSSSSKDGSKDSSKDESVITVDENGYIVETEESFFSRYRTPLFLSGVVLSGVVAYRLWVRRG